MPTEDTDDDAPIGITEAEADAIAAALESGEMDLVELPPDQWPAIARGRERPSPPGSPGEPGIRSCGDG